MDKQNSPDFSAFDEGLKAKLLSKCSSTSLLTATIQFLERDLGYHPTLSDRMHLREVLTEHATSLHRQIEAGTIILGGYDSMREAIASLAMHACGCTGYEAQRFVYCCPQANKHVKAKSSRAYAGEFSFGG
jgi:lipopolysaccharide biosynthesis regulator YciM